jgi:hypothetical protein
LLDQDSCEVLDGFCALVGRWWLDTGRANMRPGSLLGGGVALPRPRRMSNGSIARQRTGTQSSRAVISRRARSTHGHACARRAPQRARAPGSLSPPPVVLSASVSVRLICIHRGAPGSRLQQRLLGLRARDAHTGPGSTSLEQRNHGWQVC